MKALHILSVLLLVAAPHRACAWGDDGHKTIALVAEQYLEPAAKTKIAAMGRPLSLEDPQKIRMEIEAFDDIDVVGDEIRGIVARNWPHLLSKLPPEDE